jgi:L-alanine-DL-glutamate epimerase-like enolase superfamily enzyme
LKITAIETVVVNAVYRNWVFVKVLTDQPGLYGWGEATLEWKTRAVVATIEDLSPLVIGEDATRIEHVVRRMTHMSFWPLGVIGMTALSGIEQALWDIKGKALNVPVWQLLGGQVRDRVRAMLVLPYGTVEEVCAAAAAGVAEGYTALKVLLFQDEHHGMTHAARLSDRLGRRLIRCDITLFGLLELLCALQAEDLIDPGNMIFHMHRAFIIMDSLGDALHAGHSRTDQVVRPDH